MAQLSQGALQSCEKPAHICCGQQKQQRPEEWLSSAGVPCSTIINMADGVLYIAGLSRIVERDMKRMYEVVRSLLFSL